MAEQLATTPTSTTPAAPAADTSAPAQRSAPVSPSAAPRAGSIPDAQWDSLPPAEQERFARLKAGPDGGSIWVHRDQLGKEPAADGKQPGATVDGQASVTEDGKLRVGEMLLSEDDIKSLMTQKATADLRATQVPADAAAYEPRLPEGIKLPGDLQFKVDAADPALQDLRGLAKRIGLTQSEFSDVLAVYAGSEARKEAEFRTAMAGELTKMGANATMRVTAIETGLRGLLGDDLGGAMKSMIVSEKLARGFETLLQKFASQGVASFRQDGREPPNPNRGPLSSMSEAEYNALTPAEKYSIAKRG
jgi:hypothetical protein